jgi:N-acylneuraminate cytidylyltransferase
VYAGRRFLGLIPARGGSVGLPGKHLLDLGGQPVLAWTARAARASELLDTVVLTTDDDDVAEAGRELGLDVPFRRPARLATDQAAMEDVVEHALTSLDGPWDAVAVLQPTSPLRTEEDIDAAIRIFADNDAPSCVSVTLVRQHPSWMYRVDADMRMVPFVDGEQPSRRQELDPVYALNGAVYVLPAVADSHVRFVVPGTRAYVMPPERSVDLDTEQDMRMLRALADEAS